MDEWEQRLAAIFGEPVAPVKSVAVQVKKSKKSLQRESNIKNSRPDIKRVFTVRNNSKEAVELSVSVYAGPNGGVSPALSLVQRRIRVGLMKQLLLPGSSIDVYEEELTGNRQLFDLIAKGILAVKYQT